MIQEHIHSLLFEHDCVIIPDFGGLIAHYEPARIHPVKHSFLPPAKRIAFNEQLKLNDGLLISTLAYEKHLTQEEAQRQVAAFARNLTETLRESHRVELKGIGVFRLNAERNIEFDYIPSENFRNDSFGLPELIARPIIARDAAGLRTLLKEKQKEQAFSTSKPTLRKKVRRIYDIASVFAITGLTIGAFYFISLQTDYSLSSLNPFALFSSAENVKTETPSTSEDIPFLTPEDNLTVVPANVPEPAEPKEVKTDLSVSNKSSNKENNATKTAEIKVNLPEKTEVTKVIAAKEKPAAAPVKPLVKSNETKVARTITGVTGRYYVIAGGYNSLKNAEYTRLLLEKQHQKESKIIDPYPGSKLHRVTISDFASKEEALQQLPQLKKKFGKNIWILNY